MGFWVWAFTITVIPVGYADGMDRGLSNKGFVRFGAEYCPIVGRISMDEITVRIDTFSDPAASVMAAGCTPSVVDDCLLQMDMRAHTADL